MSFTNAESMIMFDMLTRLTERVQQIELNREFKTAPIMVSERETIRDLVTLAALKFGVSEKDIYGEAIHPPVHSARKWVCSEAHLSRGIPADIIGWILGERSKSVINLMLFGKARGK